MRIIPTTLLFALCLALFSGACWARGTTVGVGETVPLGGTTTTTTTTTNTTTTTTEDEGSSEPIHQVTITPADGGDAGSTEGSDWENLGVMGGSSGDGASGSGEASGTGESSTGGTASAQQNQQDSTTSDSGCAPALVLAGIGLALFAFRN